MNASSKNQWTWIPFVLIGVAFISAAIFVNTDVELLRRYVAGVFGGALGGALLLWGSTELLDGKIQGRRVYVSRHNNPTIFFLLVGGKRFIPGAIMLLVGFWYAFFG